MVLEGISHGICQRIFNYCAQKEIDTRPPKKVRLIGIDDPARKKGRN